MVAGLIVLLSSLYLWQERRIGGGLGFPLDDAWIHARFARNLARGDGFALNQGEPVPGSTSPLWVILLAGSYLVTGEMVLTAKILGIALLILGVWTAYRLTLRITDDRRWATWVMLLVALSPHLIWGAVSGMEVSLYVFLTLLGLDWYLRYRDDDGPRAYSSTAVFALAALARPECYLLFAFALVDRVGLGLERIRKGSLSTEVIGLASHALLYTLILLPNWAFNYATIGSIFPATFQAKVQGGLLNSLAAGDIPGAVWAASLNSLSYVQQFTGFLAEVNLFLLLALPFGLVGLCLAPLAPNGPAGQRSWLVPLTFILYPFFVGAVFVARQFGGVVTRYIANLIPLYILIAVIGLHYLRPFVAVCLRESHRRDQIGRSIGGALLILALAYSIAAQWESSVRHGWMVENINHLQVALGQWSATNLPPNAVLAVNDIGAISYFSNHRIIDTVGLVTPEVVRYIDAAGSRDEGVMRFLAEKRPDYVIIFPDWYPRLSGSPVLEEVYSITLSHPVAVGSPRMVVYRAHWP